MDLSKQTGVARKVWDEHGQEDYRQDQSHWRGVGRWGEDTWTAIGKNSLLRIRNWARMLDRPMPKRPKVLEWGPGGGANLYAFRKLAKTYYGVDISQRNLDEAQRMIGAEADSKVTFAPILLDAAPSSIPTKIEKVDLFLSTACFQHFPSKEYGFDVLKAIRASCKAGAFGVIQIRYDNGAAHYKPMENVSDYKERHLTANSYQLDEFSELAREAGFSSRMIGNVTPNNNYAVFYLAVSPPKAAPARPMTDEASSRPAGATSGGDETG